MLCLREEYISTYALTLLFLFSFVYIRPIYALLQKKLDPFFYESTIIIEM